MMRAVVIRTAGDRDFSDAIVDGIIQPLKTHELEAVKAEMQEQAKRLRESEAQNGVRKIRDTKYFKRRIRRANRLYPVREPSKPAQVLLVGWALVWLAIFECYRRLAAWNREP